MSHGLAFKLPHAASATLSEEDKSICVAFNMAARRIAGPTPEASMTPTKLQLIFDATRTELSHQHNGVRIMHALLRGGLQAPKAMMPEGFEGYALDAPEEGRSQSAFNKAERGPGEVVPHPAFLPRTPEFSAGLAHLTLTQ